MTTKGTAQRTGVFGNFVHQRQGGAIQKEDGPAVSSGQSPFYSP